VTQAEDPASEGTSTPAVPSGKAATTPPPTAPAKILQIQQLEGLASLLALDQDGSIWMGTLPDDPRVPSSGPIRWDLIWSGL